MFSTLIQIGTIATVDLAAARCTVHDDDDAGGEAGDATTPPIRWRVGPRRRASHLVAAQRGRAGAAAVPGRPDRRADGLTIHGNVMIEGLLTVSQDVTAGGSA